MKSFTSLLKKNGMGVPFSLKKNFQTNPTSFKEVLRILSLEKPNFKSFSIKKVYSWEGGENEWQGITCSNDNTWYLSNRWKLFKFINQKIRSNKIKFSRIQSTSLKKLLKSTTIDNPHDYDHFGDISYHNGIIFVPIRRAPKKNIVIDNGDPADEITSPPIVVKKRITEPPHLLLGVSKDLEAIGYSKLPKSSSDWWCAINPWNSLLYIPDNENRCRINSFDISEYYKILNSKVDWGENITIINGDKHLTLYKENKEYDTHGGQGGLFSKNGRLYISESKNKGILGWENFIYAYNSLTGIRLDRSKEYDFEDIGDEIEGITIDSSGVMFVSVNDWESCTDDDLHIYTITSNNPLCPL
jgi:hypothetical protein